MKVKRNNILFLEPRRLMILLFLSIHITSFCQSQSDSTFIQEIIHLELKERDKRMKKAYPIFEISAFSERTTRTDTVYTQYNFGREINWLTFGITSKYGYFTTDKMIDSCLYIHSPLFNKNNDTFIIKYEVRFKNLTSYFIVDYYRKKRGKWNFVKTSKSFSF